MASFITDDDTRSADNRSAQLVRQIKQAFFKGEYLPGQALASQRSMSQQLGLSRSTVREAMGQLESEGYISVRPGGKTHCNNLLEVCFDMPLEGLGDNLEFQQQVLEIRAMLEGEAAYYAALRASDEQLAKVDAEYQQLLRRDKGETTLAKAKEDLRFHMLIAEASQHLLVVSFSEIFYSRFFNAIYGVLSRTLKKRGRYPDGIRAQHASIHQALMARDPDAAREAATNHILYTLKQLTD